MRRAIGIIVPSGNVVVERAAIAFAAEHPGLDVHFSRVPVRGSIDPMPDGYDMPAFLAAAELLADARPGAIVWAGSKGVLVGMAVEEALRAAIVARTGLPFTSSSFALVDLAMRRPLRRIGLVTPYTDAYQQRLIAGFVRLGLTCVSEAHLGIAANLAYADPDETAILAMAHRVAEARPDALVAWCTNFRSAFCRQRMVEETGLRVLDATELALEAGFALADPGTRPEGMER